VDTLLRGVPLNASFRRYLTKNNLVLWHNLLYRIMGACLNK
jgi:hypothetical protein